jgi:glycogen debranching enzyme
VQARAAELSEEQNWCQQITRIRSDKATFNRVIERGEQDLYLLRQSFGKPKAVSAGVPWFSTLFGRDALITASQTLMLNPEIARETLILLADYQGKVEDEWREEEPGKILHELRLGEMARCQEILIRLTTALSTLLLCGSCSTLNTTLGLMTRKL